MLNLLRGGVFLLALAAAFAFTNPVPQGLTQYGNDNGTYVPLTGLVEGTDFACQSDPRPCIVTFANNDPQSGQMTVVKPGIWRDLR